MYFLLVLVAPILIGLGVHMVFESYFPRVPAWYKHFFCFFMVFNYIFALFVIGHYAG